MTSQELDSLEQIIIENDPDLIQLFMRTNATELIRLARVGIAREQAITTMLEDMSDEN